MIATPLADFGIGDAVSTAVAGEVCLIQRGTVDFATKVSNCQNSGAAVYNNAAGGFGGTLGETVTSIPSLNASDVECAAMKNQLAQSAIVRVEAANHACSDGTSMATPHVSAVAALVWSYFPTCTASQISNALLKTAHDLGCHAVFSFWASTLLLLVRWLGLLAAGRLRPLRPQAPPRRSSAGGQQGRVDRTIEPHEPEFSRL